MIIKCYKYLFFSLYFSYPMKKVEEIDDDNWDDDETKGGKVDDRSIAYQGFLLKKGQINTAWKRRYFILKNDILFYFKDSDDMFHPQGMVYLYEATLDQEAVQEKTKNTFIIKSKEKGKKHVLQAETTEEKKKWISVILEKCKGIDYSKQEKEISEARNQSKQDSEHKTSLENNIKGLTFPMNALQQNIVKFLDLVNSYNKSPPIDDETDPDFKDYRTTKNFSDSLNVMESNTKLMVYINRKAVILNELINKNEDKRVERLEKIKIGLEKSQEILKEMRKENNDLKKEILSKHKEIQDLIKSFNLNTSKSNNSELTNLLQQEEKQKEQIKELTNQKRVLIKEIKSMKTGK